MENLCKENDNCGSCYNHFKNIFRERSCHTEMIVNQNVYWAHDLQSMKQMNNTLTSIHTPKWSNKSNLKDHMKRTNKKGTQNRRLFKNSMQLTEDNRQKINLDGYNLKGLLHHDKRAHVGVWKCVLKPVYGTQQCVCFHRSEKVSSTQKSSVMFRESISMC